MWFPRVTLRLADWVDDALLSEEHRVYPVVEDRVQFAIELSRSNIRHGTGGPFRATIFKQETDPLLAPALTW